MNEKRKDILDRLANGEITSNEAEQLMKENAPTASEQMGKIMTGIAHGAVKVGKGIGTLADSVAQQAKNKSDNSNTVKQNTDTFVIAAREVNVELQLPIVKTHAREASITAAASGLLPGAGPTVAAMTSAGFVLSMLHKINTELGVKIPKAELKSVADSIVHTITPMAGAKYLAASGLSFIPVVGNVAAGALMASVCYSITYASGIVYLELLQKLVARQADLTVTADDLKTAAAEIIDNGSMAQVLEEAQSSYESTKGGTPPSD